MPSLTLQVPNSEWAKLEAIAKQEGVSVRMLLVWKLKGELGLPIRAPLPPIKPDEQAA